MPDKILHKRSLIEGSVPLTSSLSLGELAINVADGKIYFRRSGSYGDVIQTVVSTNNITSGSVNISGSLIVTGSLISPIITGSLFGTASWANNSITASSADDFLVRGTLTAQRIVVQTITSSVNVVTGSTQFGSILSNTHEFTGSVIITGSLNILGAGITGSVFGTSSWSENAINSISASYLSGSTAIVDNFTSSYDILVNNSTIGRGRVSNTINNLVIGSGSFLATSSTTGFSGSGNTIMGHVAAQAAIIGDDNTGVGFQVLRHYTGSYTTAIGAYSLTSASYGRFTAVGAYTLYQYVSGGQNNSHTAIGVSALSNLRSGSGNTSIGDSSMYFAQKADFNTAVGHVALRDLREGVQNTAVGAGAIYQNFLSGSANTVVGFDTAKGLRTGSFNTIIGANIVGLPSELNNNIILSDGQGNIKARYSSSIWTMSDSTVGNFTGSLFGTSSWALNSLTASYVEAGAVQNLNLFKISTGSIDAAVNITRESLFLISSGSKRYFNVSSSGNTDIYSSLFIVRDFTTSAPVFTVSQSIAKFATQSSAPVGTTEAGAIWFTSTDMYIGLD